MAGAGVSTPIVSGDRVYVTSQIGAGVRREGNHPRLVQGSDAAAQGERALGATAAGADPRRPTSSSRRSPARDGKRDLGAPHRGRGRPHAGARQAQPGDAESGHRRLAGLSRGLAPARSSRSIEPGAIVWQRHLAKENGAFDIQWGHGTSPVLHGDLLILLCDQPARSYLARGRQEDGQGSLEGGPRQGTRVVQHAARRGGRGRHRDHRELDRADRRLRRENGIAPLARRRDQPLRGAVAGVSRRRHLRQPRLPERPVHGDRSPAAAATSTRRRRCGGSRPARRTCRLSSTTTASSTWRTTSVC